MKVLFLNPPLGREAVKNPVMKYLFANSMPLGIGYLAAVMLQKGEQAVIIDAAAEQLTIPQTLERIKAEKPDMVALTSHTNSFAEAQLLAGELKKVSPELPLILGGVHLTCLPQQAMASGYFDYGVIGEGELTFPELAETLARGEKPDQVEGICYPQGGELVFTAPRDFIPDLDVLPFPARHLFKSRLYSSIPHDIRYLPKFTMVPTRGCPFQCIFCTSATTGSRFRTFSPQYMVAEIEHLIKDFGAKEIAFTTTTFTADQKKSEEFLDLLLEKNLKISWTVSSRVDTLTRPMLAKMKKSGCWCLRIGVESGNPQVLDFIRKKISLEQVRRVAQWCEELDIHLKAFFIIGHLIDTEASIRDSIEFALSAPLGDITVQYNTPIPGTPQYEMAKDYGELKPDWSIYHYWDPVFIPSGMTEVDLISLHHEFYRRFYSRFSTLKKHIKKIFHWQSLVHYLKSLDLFFYLISQGKK